MLPFVLGSVCFLLPRAVAAFKAPSAALLREGGKRFVFGASASQLLRLRAQTSQLYLDTFRGTQKELLGSVDRMLRAMGWRDVQLVMQDPTEPTIFTVLARGRGELLSGDGGPEIVGVEPVDEPGERSRPATRGTDPGLTEDEMRAVERALVWETNPKHLSGFAGTFTPHFPVAHALLFTKGKILEDGWSPRACADALPTLVEISRQAGFGANVTRVWETLAQEKAGEKLPPPRKPRPVLSSPVLREACDSWAAANRFPPELLAQECQRALGLMVEDQAADAISAFPPPFQMCAAACLSPNSFEFALPIPGAVRRLFPPRGDEGFVSPTALQLAESEMKPVAAGVTEKARVPAVLHDVASQADMGNAEAMRARAMVEKAEKAIDRARWVDWYESEVGT